MSGNQKVKKFENVEIQFVNLEDATTETATILVRPGEMVIDVSNPDDPQITDYLMIGKSTDYYFRGRNSASNDMPRAVATWTMLADSYVGVWLEDGIEYLFSFELRD